MKKHDIDIGLGAYSFPYVTEVSCESSWDMLTDVGSIVVPRKVQFNGQTIAQGTSLFRRGDVVTVRLGYDGQYDDIFAGHISGIKPGVPLEFELEDAMWQLKQGSVTASYRSANLRTLLSDISPIPYEAVEAEIGPLRITDATPAQVLEMLRKKYGVQSWCRDGKLYSGLAYWPDLGQTHTFRFSSNIIEADLEYVQEKDVRLRVKAISIERDNSRLQVELGDPDGELRTLNYYSLGSEKALRETAERELQRLRFEGYRGSITTFGRPAVQHGDTIDLQDPKHPDRNGKYLVKKVRTTGGVGGYRQVIHLDTKIA